MAKISEVRHLLRSLPSTKFSPKKNGVFPLNVRGDHLQLAESVVDQYIAVREKIKRPQETAIFLPGYFEQAVEFQRRGLIRRMRGDAIELENKEKTRKIVISTISDLFAVVLLDCEELSQELNRFIGISYFRLRHESGQDSPNTISTLLGRIRTVKVMAKSADALASNVKRLQDLCEAALFHVAYGSGVGISLSTSWEKAYYRFGLRRDESVQFPLRTYNSDLLAYYHLAFGSNSLILAYLALYKILEFFFTSSAERVLHTKISDKLTEPDFLHTKTKKLRELVKTIRVHDSRMDEKRMLTTVLSDYFDPEELRNWVSTHESDHGPYFTEEHQVFAEPVRVDTSNDQIFATVAHRIYHIRNALVHYKEGEVSRFIPFSGQEKVLFREIPLLLFLAEQLILKTGKNI